MKKLCIVFILFFFIAPAQSQVLESITAKEVLPKVSATAQSDFAADAYLTLTLFYGLEFQGITLEMSTDDGKATGWLYRYYSSSLDSSIFIVGAKIPILGEQALILDLDTISNNLPVTIGTTELTEPWVDSDGALQGSKDGGAETFLQSHPDARIGISFALNNPVQNQYIPQGQYWLLRYLASSDTLTCMVHAETGQPYTCLQGNDPRITSVPQTLARVGVLYNYHVRAFGDPVPGFSLPTQPAGMTIDAVTGLIEWTPTAQQTGNQDVTVRASNPSGSDEQSYTITVLAEASAPSITSTPVTEAVADEEYTYNVVSSGAPPPAYSLTRNPDGMLIDRGRGMILWTPNRSQAGIQPVTVLARNTAGSDMQEYEIEVYKKPLIADIPNQRADTEALFRYSTVSDSRPDPDYTLDAGPGGLTIDPSTGLIEWTPSIQQEGIHVVLIRATNVHGFDQEAFNIVVDDPTSVHALPAQTGFRLHEHYPNPLQAGTSTPLTVPVTTGHTLPLTLTVYTMLGKEIRTITRELRGTGQFSIDVSELRSGTYYFVIKSDVASETRSFVLLR